MTELSLKKTPLNEVHRRMGARMVEFGGWEMPVQYGAGTIEEHMRVRTRAGLFDVSHMGEIEVRGPDAIAFINRLTSNNVAKLVDGQAQYSTLTTPQGTVVDDLLVYRLAADHLMLVVNAATTDKDWHWIQQHKADEKVELRNASDDFCQLAIQGPAALDVLQKLTKTALDEIKRYHFRAGEVGGVASLVSRTGYTGEDGFEIYAPSDKAEHLWELLLEAGRYGAPDGLLPCGLGARNTLRLEAAMPLYGHEIDETTTLLEAGLEWICKFDKGDFIGREALLKQKQEGVRRRLIGFEMIERGIARDGQEIVIDGQRCGRATSAGPAPYLKKNIGLGYVPVEHAGEGRRIHIDVRGRLLAAQIVPTPFYKRPRR